MDVVGASGNERLTALIASVIFVLLAVQAFTLLSVGQLLTVHEAVGLTLIGVVAAKLLSVGWRFVAYYRGAKSYRRKGPPHRVMRVLGPLLALATAAVLGTGVTMLVTGCRGRVLLLHQASFFVWLALLAPHVLVYVWRVPRLLAARPPAET
jgi:hypothetical protein